MMTMDKMIDEWTMNKTIKFKILIKLFESYIVNIESNENFIKLLCINKVEPTTQAYKIYLNLWGSCIIILMFTKSIWP